MNPVHHSYPDSVENATDLRKVIHSKLVDAIKAVFQSLQVARASEQMVEGFSYVSTVTGRDVFDTQVIRIPSLNLSLYSYGAASITPIIVTSKQGDIASQEYLDQVNRLIRPYNYKESMRIIAAADEAFRTKVAVSLNLINQIVSLLKERETLQVKS